MDFPIFEMPIIELPIKPIEELIEDSIDSLEERGLQKGKIYVIGAPHVGKDDAFARLAVMASESNGMILMVDSLPSTVSNRIEMPKKELKLELFSRYDDINYTVSVKPKEENKQFYKYIAK